MDFRSILARQLSQSQGKPSSIPASSFRPQLQSRPLSPPPSPNTAATTEGTSTLERKRKRPLTLGLEATAAVPVQMVAPRSQEKEPVVESSDSPPRFPAQYTPDSNIFLEPPTSSLGFELLHSLGSVAERKHMSATKLRTCTLNGANDLVRGLLQKVDCMDRSGSVCAEARAEVSEYRSRMKVLRREMAEFKEIHSATIDSLKSEADKFKNELAEQKQMTEVANVEAEAVRKEAKTAREDLETFQGSEAERHAAFLLSQKFKEILGPKAFRFLQIGFQSCLDQFTEAGLLPSDADPAFPSMDKAVSSVLDDVLEDAPDQVVAEKHGEEAENPETA